MRSRVLPVVVWFGLAASATGVGLTTVAAVRGVVADEPVRVLSAADVAALLAEPGADLAPLATLTASDSLPAGAPGTDEGRQVASREAVTAAELDLPDVPTNADDRPSRLGSEPGTLAGRRGGPARTTRTQVRVDELVPSGGNPRAPVPSPTPSATQTPSPSSPPSSSPTEPGPSPDGTPSPSASGPSPSASSSPPPASPSPTPSPTPGPPSPTPDPSRSPVASPTPTRPPAPGAARRADAAVVRGRLVRSASTGWGLLLPGR